MFKYIVYILLICVQKLYLFRAFVIIYFGFKHLSFDIHLAFEL
jgi:hypothetical protein